MFFSSVEQSHGYSEEIPHITYMYLLNQFKLHISNICIFCARFIGARRHLCGSTIIHIIRSPNDCGMYRSTFVQKHNENATKFSYSDAKERERERKTTTQCDLYGLFLSAWCLFDIFLFCTVHYNNFTLSYCEKLMIW